MSGLASWGIDTAILDTWDVRVLERFDGMRSAHADERFPLTLTLSQGCIGNLDRTLNVLRRRAHSRTTAPTATGAELVALRSAAVEVAAETYVAQLLRRLRQSTASTGRRERDAKALEIIQRATGQAAGEPIVCMLGPSLAHDLEEVAEGLLRENQIALNEQGVTPELIRSVMVESVLTSWLILRGYSETTAGWAPQQARWLIAVKRIAHHRRRCRGA